MAKLQEEIANSFLEKLRESTAVTPDMIDGLRDLLSGKKKLKPDDLEQVFMRPPGRAVK